MNIIRERIISIRIVIEICVHYIHYIVRNGSNTDCVLRSSREIVGISILTPAQQRVFVVCT